MVADIMNIYRVDCKLMIRIDVDDKAILLFIGFLLLGLPLLGFMELKAPEGPG
jgi:hypothetical protein